MNIIELQNVSKQYGNHIVLDKVSLSIPQGSIFGLLGPNGAGKTSLIRMITGITAPDAGQIFYKSELLNAKHISQMGYLPEERGLYKKMKVGDQLLYLARLKGLKKADAFDKLSFWVKKFEMIDWLEKPVESLSKGMQQKVQFVATIIHNPELIILDEPFTGFDPLNANLIKDEILELKEKGCTIIFSTHRMESVEELCSQIAMVYQSKLVLEGSTKQLKSIAKAVIYKLVCSAQITLDAGKYTILSEQASDELFTYEIEMENGSSSDLASVVAQQAQVYHFAAKVPSMSDIFIDTIQKAHL